MVENGLLGRLVRKSRVLFTVGALAGPIYGCDDDVIQPNPKPTANFTRNPKEGYAPVNVCFDGSSSTAPRSSIVKYIWSFEPGVMDSTSGVRPCYNYQNPGEGNVGLVVEDAKGERSAQKLEQIIRRDGSPVVNISSFNFNEDGTYVLDLNEKVTSPLYPLASLTITATSPDLNVIINPNNLQASITNKTKDWESSTKGPAYIDWAVADSGSRQANTRTGNIIVASQTDIRSYLEHVLTGERVPGIQLSYVKGLNDTLKINANANGEFELQVPNSNDTLRIITPIDSTKFVDTLDVRFFKDSYYIVKIPINASGQDVNLGNLQLIQRAYETQIVQNQIIKVDLLSFTQDYMLPARWDDADMPIKVFIGSPPSTEYEGAVRRGIMDLWQPVINQWLPPGRQINLAEIVNSDPVKGVRVDYTANGGASHGWNNNILFKKGVIEMNPAQVGDIARSTSVAHELGHIFGFLHSSYLNQIMNGINLSNSPTPSPFEVLVLATKYKLKKGSTGIYSR
ncbi:hypothetical protein J4422_04205 [Candidatus Pacearchaeota archaeon]|nr:hypothetical protein [Candidatus Pacearchaeota archaeon]